MSSRRYELILFVACILKLTAIDALNSIDLNEIDNLKYNIEILNVPQLLTDAVESGGSFLSLTSVYGQTYQCNLTNTIPTSNEALDVKSQNTFNFTQINEELNSTLAHLKSLDQCLYKVGWTIK